MSIFFLLNFNGLDTGTGATTTLTSAGGTSLVSDGTGPTLSIKGLTSGTGMNLIDNGTSIEIESTVISPYQQSADDITPVSTSVNAIVSGTGNTIQGTNNIMAGAVNSGLIGSRTSRSGIIASINSFITTSGGNGDGKHCCIVASDSGTIGTGNNAGTGHGLYSSNNGLINERGFYCSVLSSVNSSILGEADYTSVIACNGCTFSGDRVNNGSMIGSNNCQIRTRGGSLGNGLNIYGSFNCQIGSGTNDTGNFNAIYNSLNSRLDETCLYNAIISGNNSIIDGSGDNNNVLLGSNATITHAGNFIFSDSAGGTRLTTISNHQFSVRCANGSRFFTNTSNSVGVSLGAGGNAWGSVCDVNVKENMVLLNNHDISLKVESIPVYKYNYIGNPVEQICYGPTAQDWNAQFGCVCIESPVVENSVDEAGNTIEIPVLDDAGDPVLEMKPVKDPLKIESMDMMGVLMATIQDLQTRVKALEDLQF